MRHIFDAIDSGRYDTALMVALLVIVLALMFWPGKKL